MYKYFIRLLVYVFYDDLLPFFLVHESSVGLSSTTNPSLGVAPIYAIVLSSAHSGGQPIDCYSRKTDPILYMFSNGHLKL